jgi:excisionase family DNA binding protein
MESTDVIPEKRTFTPREVAEILKVDRRTVYNWFYDGTLPYFKVGPRLRRVRRDDLLIIINVK